MIKRKSDNKINIPAGFLKPICINIKKADSFSVVRFFPVNIKCQSVSNLNAYFVEDFQQIVDTGFFLVLSA